MATTGHALLEEALLNLSSHELSTNHRYAVFKSTKDFGKTGIETARKVYFEDQASVKRGRQEFTGIPFVVLGQKVFDCQFGRNRKEKRRKMPKQKTGDHERYVKGKKFVLQDTKKLDCPARCVFRDICRFPSHKIQSDSVAERSKICNDIMLEIKSGCKIEHTREIVTCFPSPEEHTCHTKEEVVPEPIDPRLSNKISEMCKTGVNSLQTMKNVLNSYVKDICNPVPQPGNKRFYPSDKCILNHIYRSTRGDKKDDQEMLIDLIREWQNKGDFIYCRLKSSECNESEVYRNIEYGNRFLFIYQSKDQKRLLQRYGSTVFMDATYKTSLYDLPLFFLAVKTNVDFQVVGTFVTEDETIESIAEALKLLKTNCPELKPSFFMTDFDESEICAIEKVFKGATTLICDFHRNQAWERWLRKKENSLGNSSAINQFLQKLANASNAESFEATLQEIKESELWKNNDKLQQYLEKTWLPHKKRWSKAYRNGLEIVAGTNNGLESHHNVFKRKYMHGNSSYNLTNMLKTLINDFFPSRYRLYMEKNQMFSGKFRKYSSEVPPALQFRPRNFIKHCLESLESSKSIQKSHVNCFEDGRFTIESVCGTLGDNEHMPSCSCNQWFSYHMPCRHMIAAISKDTEPQWHKLSQLYMQSVYCIIDDFEDVTVDTPSEDRSNVLGASTQCASEVLDENVKALSEDDTEENLKKCAVSARDVIKKLLNVTYNITDKKTLKHIENNVRKLIEEVQPRESIPLLPLPKRVTKKKFRKRVTNLRKINTESVPSQTVQEEITMDTDMLYTVPEASNQQDVEVLGTCNNDSDNATQLVNKLWSLNVDLHTPVAKPYGITVTDTDIRSLKPGGWLTDNIFDCYLNMLCTELREQVPKKNVLHFVTSLMTSIVSGMFKINQSRGFQHNLSEYETVIGIYGRSSHWTLIIVHIPEKRIYFYNPTGESKCETTLILENWKKFIKQYNSFCQKEMTIEWTLCSKAHTVQDDSYNCGVYCLIFAEKHLQKDFGSLTNISHQDLNEMRRKCAKKLMMFEVFLTDCCPKCGQNIAEADPKLQCSTCGRCFHFKPYCVEEDINILSDGDSFSCTLCRHNYWIVSSTGKLTSNSYIWTDKIQALNDLSKTKVLQEEVEIIEKETLKVNPIERDTDRRNKPKRKSTSYIYPMMIKKMKRQKEHYCVCREPYKDGESMWCCDTCSIWYHPRCIGRDDNETPPKKETSFLCEACLSDHIKGWSVENIFDVVQPEDDEDNEEGYYVTTEDVQRHIRKCYQRCWYVIRMEGNKSSVPWMKRHIIFLNNRRSFGLKGFGEALFSPQAICMISMNLQRQFKSVESSKLYSLKYEVPGMANNTLRAYFDKLPGQCEYYIEQVLVREAMVKIMQEINGDSYTNVNNELKKTEGRNISSVFELICNYKKEGMLTYISKHQRK